MAAKTEQRRDGIDIEMRASPSPSQESSIISSERWKRFLTPSLSVLYLVCVTAVLVFVAGRGVLTRAPVVVQPPHAIVVIVVDTLRRDHLSCYGYHRQTTPAIDAVASQGALFLDAHTNGNWTKPAVASLFTGLWPSETGVLKMFVTVGSDDAPETMLYDGLGSLAGVLSGQGYACGGFVNNPHLAGELGFARGFDVYEHGSFSCDEIVERFLAWQAGLEGAKPFFAYLHFLEPHATYAAREPFRDAFRAEKGMALPEEQTMEYPDWAIKRDEINAGMRRVSEAQLQDMIDLYDGEIAWADNAVGTLTTALMQRGVYDDGLVVVTSDHGENFLEHGVIEHPVTVLYEPQVRIPLVVKFPLTWGITPARISGPVETMDISYTVAEAGGAGAFGRGESLLSFAAAGRCGHRTVITEGVSSLAVYTGVLKACFKEDYSGASIFRVYNVRDDAGETRDLLAMKPTYAARTTGDARRWREFAISRADGMPAPGGSVPRDEERMRQLRALGYLR